MSDNLEIGLHVIPLLKLARFAAEANDVLIELDCVQETYPQFGAAMSGSTTVDAERSEVGELVSAVLWVAIGMLNTIEQRSFKEVAA